MQHQASTTTTTMRVQMVLGKRKCEEMTKNDCSRCMSGCNRYTKNVHNFVYVNRYEQIDELIQVAFEHEHCLSPRNMSAVWHRLSRLMTASNHSPNQQQERHQYQLHDKLNTLFAYTIDELKEYGTIQLSQSAMGMAKIIKAVRFCGNGREMNCHQMFQDSLIGSDMKRKDSLFQAIASAAVPLLHQFDPQGYSNLVYACAIADAVPRFRGSTLFEHIACTITALKDLRTFKPQELSNVVWAYATAQVSHSRLFEKVADEVTVYRHLGSFNSQNLSNIVWAFATAQVSYPRLFHKVADEVIAYRHLGSFNPQALSNIVWAYATAQVSHPHLFKQVAGEVAHRCLGSLNPQVLSNIVWAYATAKVSHPLLFDRLVGAAIARKHELSPQEVSNILWSYSASGIVESSLFAAMAPRVMTLLKHCSCQHIANIAWSYAVANVDSHGLFNKPFTNALLERMDSFNVAQFSQLYQWHIWQKEENSYTGLPLVFERRCYEVFTSLNPTISLLQRNVSSVLRSIDLVPKEEEVTQKGYSIDALVEVKGKKVGVEVDGPSHFIGRKPTGSTILKRRQVANVEGIALVSVPYWEWDELGQDLSKKQNYLRSLLGIR
mmetsp:Transcript_7488/g.13469  ORF Transcript_7488/g.13469 Transcript_7488/m.13469 type:complete len:606 (+) Transcript_7488:178-1995(+)